MKHPFLFPYILLASILSPFAVADELDEVLQSTVNNLNIRGASIAYYDKSKHSKPILRSYGKVASSSNSQSVTPDTAFTIASVSKVLTGAAVLKLVSMGTIALDDDICDVLPNNYAQSACRNPSYSSTPVTWRMLVTHRSSLRADIPSFQGKDPSYGPDGGYGGSAQGNPTCPLTDVKGFYRDFMIQKDTETSVGSGININWYQVASSAGGAWSNFKPGSRRQYSNFAVGYIAALIEHATGMSFPQFCKMHIFDPLKMENTSWFRETLPSSTQTAMPVEYYPPFRDFGYYCYIDYASGQLWTTAEDMSKFLQSMFNYGFPTLWSKEDGQSAVRCAEGSNVNNCEFGINWILMNKNASENWMNPISSLDWTDAVAHDGAEAGSQTQVVLLPKAGIYAAVLTNTDYNDELAAQKLMKQVLTHGKNVVETPVTPSLPPSPTPPSPPAPSPVSNEIPSAPCPKAWQKRFVIQVTTDRYGYDENSFKVKMRNKRGKFKKVRFSKNTLPSNDTVIYSKCLPKRKCYKLFFYDSYYDGICCEEGQGSITALWDKERIVSSSFDDGRVFTQQFGNC